MPVSSGAVKVWLDGEIYDCSLPIERYGGSTGTNHIELIGAIYSEAMKSNQGWGFLQGLSGEFSMVILDEERDTLHLITDRMASRQLFYFFDNKNLSWAQEIKAFLEIAKFQAIMSRETAEEFLSSGYLSDNKTWFENVYRIPGSTVITFDLRSRSLIQRKYWDWQTVEPLRGPLDVREVVDEVSRLFHDAVYRRVKGKLSVGVPLSGGLDSRLILASIPDEYSDHITAYTFGKSGCDDVSVAKRVARKMGREHLVFELNSSNWLDNRIRGVWLTDGLLDLLHMHGIEFMADVRKNADVVLSGIIGGGLIGGGFLHDKDMTEIEVVEKRIVGRSVMGVALEGHFIDQRLPFFDNRLNEFIISIPPALRIRGKVYHKLLLTKFPDYFKAIPYADWGCAISYPRFIAWHYRVLRKAERFAYRKFPVLLKSPKVSMHDYPRWIRMPPARQVFVNILMSENAIFPDFFQKDKCMALLEEHMKAKCDNSSVLCRILTLELWLQQVYKNRYRSQCNE